MKTTWFNKLPSRLPPDFVSRTLVRLLPSREEIATYSRDQLMRLLQEKSRLAKLIEDDPVRFFLPADTGGQGAFMTNDDAEIQGRFFFAANKTGKTTAGAIVSGEIGEGHPLWGGVGRGTSPWLSARPKRMCFFSEDFSTHEETIVPTYASWMRKYLRDVVKGPSGNLSRVLHKNGTQVYLRTYDQGYEKAEGKDYDLVWCDEPPPRDIYTAIFRGLVATKGLLLITATLLSETWLYDEIQQPFVKIYESTMFDNQWLSDSARRNFAAMLTEEERAIRIYGKPSTLSGAIYPTFKDDSPFVVVDSDPPWNPTTDKPWPVIMAVDPHERKPLYVAWAYVTPENGLLWFDYDLVPTDTIAGTMDRLKARDDEHKAPTALVVIDPNRGQARQIDGKSWESAFGEFGYSVMLGNDDLQHGHFVVREMLATTRGEGFGGRLDGEVAPPRMRWTDRCRGKGGPIYQLVRYTWDDWQRGSRFERGLKEKPKEKFKDFPDLTRYAAVAIYDDVISFDSLMVGEEALSMIDDEYRGTNSYLR